MNIDHSSRSHALLSASSAAKWMACPPSARLESQMVNITTKYAAEGTVAHEVCDAYVNFHIGNITKEQLDSTIRKISESEYYSGEMLTHAQDFLDFVISETRSDDAVILPETRIDFSKYVPDGFGTGDVIIVQDDTLTVIDYKYGQGHVVEAHENPQMRLYALGAIEMFSDIYDFTQVKMCIFQPRVNNIVFSIEKVKALKSWGNKVLKPIAKLAYEGKGEFQAGDHCVFCKMRTKCKALANNNLSVISDEFENLDGELDVNVLKPEDYAMILERSKLIKNWLTDVEEYVLANMLDGSLEVPGYKVVEGRSTRKFIDMDKVADVLIQNGYEESVIYNRTLISMTNMEKLLGKKEFNNLLGDHVEKPRGKPTVVPTTDKRPVYTSVDDFEQEVEE